MKVLGIIPARLAATRFPNKPLAQIEGMPMIGHCYFRSKMCTLLDDVYVATCDTEIKEYIDKVGGKSIMTANTHDRASERTAEALINIEKQLGRQFDIIVMIQGDEPLIDPDMIREAAEPLLKGDKLVSNLMASLPDHKDRINPNYVKVVTDLQKKALYLSREAIPSNKNYKKEIETFRQLGLIAFTRKALLQFVELEPSTLEIIESVDMNRFLDYGIPIHMVVTQYEADSVDTPEDLIRVKEKMRKDKLYPAYKL